MIRVLRHVALAVAATSLAGCALAPILSSSDEPAAPKPTASTRDPDTKTAKIALAAAVERLSIFNEGSYTLWLMSEEKGSSEQTYFERVKTQYDLSRGMIEAEIDALDGTATVRILKSKGVYIKVKVDGGKESCWYRSSLKEFNAVPGVPFAYDLEADSALTVLLDEGTAESIKPDPDEPSARIVRIRSSIQNVLRVASPGTAGQFATDIKGIKGRMAVDVYLSGNEVTLVDFDLVPVFDALDDIGLGPAIPVIDEFRGEKPRGQLELGDMRDSFKVTVPTNVCQPGEARPQLTDA
jgi:hypothetical protein